MQRGLELVRGVRRELAPYALRPAPLRHVEDRQNRASAVTGLTVSWYSRPMRSMPASARSPPRARSSSAHLRAAVHGQGCPVRRSPHLRRRSGAQRIDAPPALRVQKDEPSDMLPVTASNSRRRLLNSSSWSVSAAATAPRGSEGARARRMSRFHEDGPGLWR